MPSSLKKQNHFLSDSEKQVSILSDPLQMGVLSFQEVLEANNLEPMVAESPEILQVNLGKM